MEHEKTEPGLLDEAVLRRVLSGEKDAYEAIMRKYNQRLFRIARTFIRDEDEIEDVVQEAYIKAYEQLGRFEFRSRFSTWLVRILINEALARVKQRRRFIGFSPGEDTDTQQRHDIERQTADTTTPAEIVMNAELKEILEKAVDGLPEKYRVVYMMREIEGMSVAETSESLAISEANVKVRVNRAKEMLRQKINGYYQTGEVFQFNLVRCDRIVGNVMRKIQDAMEGKKQLKMED